MLQKECFVGIIKYNMIDHTLEDYLVSALLCNTTWMKEKKYSEN